MPFGKIEINRILIGIQTKYKSELFDYISDALSYRNAKDIDEFFWEYGCSKVTECIEKYEECGKKWQELLLFFNCDEDKLDKFLEDYYYD